ncbi:MAG: hypothetical protein CMO01_24570 [Thalassobius sp.]|nr:hypothetical protein [Thalassovita sp.]
MSKGPKLAYLKTKIVISFSMIMAALLFAGYITYQNVDTLENALEDLSKPNQKLRLLTNLLGEITMSENEIRKLVLNKERNLLKKFEQTQQPIYLTLDSVRSTITEDTLQAQQIDEISSLLKAKKRSFNAYIVRKNNVEQFKTTEEVLGEVQKNKEVEEAIEEVEKEALKERVKPNIHNKNLTIPLLFREYKSAIENYYKEYTRMKFSEEDVVKMEKLENILSDVEYSQSSNMASMEASELRLLRNNSDLTEKIRAIIRKLEKEERNINAKKQQHARVVIKDANTKIFTITIITLLLVAIFIYLIFSDITKSNYYRQELLNAKIKAERLSRVKQEFLANMSHEIRTPLNAIIGFSEQLEKTPINGQQKIYLKAVKHSSEHLLSTVNDILDFSKIDAGKLKIEKIPFRLDETIKNVSQTLSIKAEEKGIQLDVSLDDEFNQVVLGDPFRLQQVFINLINNAIKFTNEGFVEVEGEILDKLGKNLKVRLRVNDTGIGIPEDKIETIFQTFSQADTSTTRQYGGTGLGLSISQKLVKLMNGKISVESEVGKGASFIVDVSFEKSNEEELIKLEEAKSTTSVAFSKVNLLVVDDDEFNLLLCKAILSSSDLNVTYCDTGKEALKYLKKDKYQMVLTDIQMPGISGLELANYIRELKNENSQIPVIALTANVMKEDLATFKNSGITDYLLKPYKETELFLKIREHLPEKFINTESDKKTEVVEEIEETQSFYSLNKLKSFAGDDISTLTEIIDTFLISSKNDMLELQQGHTEKDKKLIKDKAHKLLNGFQNFEVHEAIGLLKKLETRADKISEKELDESVKRLVEIHTELSNELKNENKNLVIS